MVKSPGMTAARVELMGLFLRLSPSRLVASKVVGFSTAAAKLNIHVRKQKGCTEIFPVMLVEKNADLWIQNRTGLFFIEVRVSVSR